jgi:hypothetical protein
MYQREKKLHSLIHREHQQTTIGQTYLSFVDALIESDQVTVVLPVVERV